MALITLTDVVKEYPSPKRGAPVIRAVDGVSLDIEAGDYSDPRTRQQAKILMRQMLAAVLAGRPLNSRQILTELQSL